MKKKKKIINIEKMDILIFLIIIIIFIAAWIAFYPAIMTSDSVGQLQQVTNSTYSNEHPILHTFIIGKIFKIFGSVSAISMFQIIIFSFLWTKCCKTVRIEKKSKKTNIIQIIITLLVGLTPLNFMYSVTLWKDILYTYSILCMILYIYIGIKNNFNYSYFQMVVISISMVLTMKIRHNGLPIGIIMFLITLILNIKVNYKQKKIFRSIIYGLIFGIILLISYIPQFIYCKSPNKLTTSSAFTTTKVCCMGTILKQEIQLTEDEESILNSILDIETWKEIADPYWGTAIIYNEKYNEKYLNEHIDEFDEIFKKYSKQYPKEVIEYFIKSNSTAWNLSVKSWTHIIFTNNDGINEMSEYQYQTSPKSISLNEGFLKYIDKTMNNKLLYTLLYRPVVFMLIAVLLDFMIIIKKKDLKYILLILPMILNIGTYIPFVISQEVRYLYPNFLTCYFMLLLVIELEKKVKEKNNNSIEQDKYEKVLIVIPAYNEEESIKKVVNDIYIYNDNLDVVVVNDGSKDNTYDEACKTRATVIDLPNNLGIGGAVQSGYLYAYKNGYDIAIQIDADGQHDSKYINDMVKILKSKQADMVIGSRFIEKTSYKQTFFRMLGIKITSAIIKILTGTKIYDTTSGFRAINKKIIKEFANEYPYDYPEPCTNMEIIKKQYKIKEIPVEMRQRETGVSSISPMKSIKYMLKVILNLFLTKIKK